MRFWRVVGSAREWSEVFGICVRVRDNIEGDVYEQGDAQEDTSGG